MSPTDEQQLSRSFRARRDELLRIYGETKVIAVVGASDDQSKPDGNIPAYLASQGYRIIPVNPTRDTVLGRPAAPSLGDIGEPVDVVDVFRRSEHAGPFADQAVEIGAKGVWFQLGVVDHDAFRRTTDAGVRMVMDTCPAMEWPALG